MTVPLPQKQRDLVKWCGKFDAEQLSCTHAAVIEYELGEIVFFSSKCHPCRPLNVFFPLHQRVPSQPIRSSRRLCPIVACGSVARDTICLMSAVDASKDEIYRFQSGRDDGNKTLLHFFFLWRIDSF